MLVGNHSEARTPVFCLWAKARTHADGRPPPKSRPQLVRSRRLAQLAHAWCAAVCVRTQPRLRIRPLLRRRCRLLVGLDCRGWPPKPSLVVIVKPEGRFCIKVIFTACLSRARMDAVGDYGSEWVCLLFWRARFVGEEDVWRFSPIVGVFM